MSPRRDFTSIWQGDCIPRFDNCRVASWVIASSESLFMIVLPRKAAESYRANHTQHESRLPHCEKLCKISGVQYLLFILPLAVKKGQEKTAIGPDLSLFICNRLTPCAVNHERHMECAYYIEKCLCHGPAWQIEIILICSRLALNNQHV